MHQRHMFKFPYYEGFSTVWFVRFLIFVFLLVGTSTCGSNEPAAKPANNTFDKVCRFVYDGEFDSAAELIARQTGDSISEYNELAEITDQYAQLQTKRQAAKKEQYEKKLNKLKALRWGDDANDINDINDVNDVNDANDVNDVNSPVDIFAAVTSLLEYAEVLQEQLYC